MHWLVISARTGTGVLHLGDGDCDRTKSAKVLADAVKTHEQCPEEYVCGQILSHWKDLQGQRVRICEDYVAWGGGIYQHFPKTAV